MRIIDADTHIVHDKPGIPSIDIEGIIHRMDECKVEKAIVWPSPQWDRVMEPDNYAVAQGMRRYPDRLIGFAHLNPRLGLEANLAEVDRCMNDFGLCGFKFIPHLDEYAIDDEALVYPIIERALSLGAKIGIHCDVHAPTFTHPWQVARVAEAFPNARILMVHLGKPAGVTTAIKVVRKYPNITTIASDIPEPFLVRKAIDELGADRVCFGSDTPFFSMAVTLKVYEEALAGLGKDDRAMIMGGNILRVTSD